MLPIESLYLDETWLAVKGVMASNGQEHWPQGKGKKILSSLGVLSVRSRALKGQREKRPLERRGHHSEVEEDQ